MRKLLCATVIVSSLTMSLPSTADAFVIPAVTSSIGKAILKYFGKEGGEQADPDEFYYSMLGWGTFAVIATSWLVMMNVQAARAQT